MKTQSADGTQFDAVIDFLRTMTKNEGLNLTFDTVAKTYEKLRPGYVDELYNAVFEYKQINESSRVLEIGIGGGQATLPFLETGCSLTAVDIGGNFCNLCREKFKDFPKFSAVSCKFEDADFGTEYDLIYSASAFHWIDEEIGYRKVYSLLREGGVFARFANHPYRNNRDFSLSEEIDSLYAKYYYKYYNKEGSVPVEYSEKEALDRARIAEKYGFSDIMYRIFYRTRIFSASEYTLLLGTYSDHIALPEGIRSEFFSEIESTIERYGGVIEIHDTIDLQMARKN